MTMPPDRPHWLTPARCRWLAAGMILGLVGIQLLYLHTTSIDLSGDEAQYWDWSRRLDWSYYSKPPGIALLIRAAVGVFGESMPGIRTPAALLFGGIVAGIYVLSAMLYKNERLALGAAALACASPIMIYLSGAMTIDTPMIFCWTWASVLFVASARGNSLAGWAALGGVMAVGFLFKYSALLWFVGPAIWLIVHRPPGRWVRGLGLALAIAALGTIPVLIWNVQNDWVGFKHVARQTGAQGGAWSLVQPLEFLATQLGVVGPTLGLLLIPAIRLAGKESDYSAADRLLLLIGLPFLIATFCVSFVAKVQANWPAPAYVTLLILIARWLAVDFRARRGWVIATACIGIGAHVFMREPTMLFPALRVLGVPDRTLAAVDGLSRLRGWEELGAQVGRERANLGDVAFVLCDHYQQTALMAFYVPGRPRTYHAGTYFASPQRMSQYTLWADMRLDRPELIGANAVYVGKGGRLPDPLPAAFERAELLPESPVLAGGVVVERFRVWRLYGFRGLTPPAVLEKF